MTRARKARIGNHVSMALMLPTWADNTNPKQFRDTEMDPWLNVINDTEFSELLSAKFVTT